MRNKSTGWNFLIRVSLPRDTSEHLKWRSSHSTCLPLGRHYLRSVRCPRERESETSKNKRRTKKKAGRTIQIKRWRLADRGCTAKKRGESEVCALRVCLGCVECVEKGIKSAFQAGSRPVILRVARAQHRAPRRGVAPRLRTQLFLLYNWAGEFRRGFRIKARSLPLVLRRRRDEHRASSHASVRKWPEPGGIVTGKSWFLFDWLVR